MAAVVVFGFTKMSKCTSMRGSAAWKDATKGKKFPWWFAVRANSQLEKSENRQTPETPHIYDTKMILSSITNQNNKLHSSSTFTRIWSLKQSIFEIVCVHYLVQLYELGVGPRHLDSYLHYVLLLWHVGTSWLHQAPAADNESDESVTIKSHHVTRSLFRNQFVMTFTTWNLGETL